MITIRAIFQNVSEVFSLSFCYLHHTNPTVVLATRVKFGQTVPIFYLGLDYKCLSCLLIELGNICFGSGLNKILALS